MEECKNEIIRKPELIENEKREKMDELLKEYVATFDEKDQLAHKIAIEHLKSSFRLEKSIGFNKWLKQNNIK